MYWLRVYFHGPQTNWSGKVSDMETIATVRCPSLWLLKLRAQGYMRDLNAGRCGYAITNDTGVVLARSADVALKA